MLLLKYIFVALCLDTGISASDCGHDQLRKICFKPGNERFTDGILFGARKTITIIRFVANMTYVPWPLTDRFRNEPAKENKCRQVYVITKYTDWEFGFWKETGQCVKSFATRCWNETIRSSPNSELIDTVYTWEFVGALGHLCSDPYRFMAAWNHCNVDDNLYRWIFQAPLAGSAEELKQDPSKPKEIVCRLLERMHANKTSKGQLTAKCGQEAAEVLLTDTVKLREAIAFSK